MSIQKQASASSGSYTWRPLASFSGGVPAEELEQPDIPSVDSMVRCGIPAEMATCRWAPHWGLIAARHREDLVVRAACRQYVWMRGRCR